MSHRLITGLCLAVGLSLAVPAAGAAQIRASERGSVSQIVDGTTLTLEYSRPAARGRDLFGGLVPFDVVWTPGANWATTLEVDRDIRLGDADVPAGRYSMWMIPREDHWTLSLDPRPELFHFQKPDSTTDQIHIALEPGTGPHTEMLTWWFPAVSGDGAVLRMSWGTTAASLPVVVQPTEPPVIAEEDRPLYTGTYAMRIAEGLGWPTSAEFEVWDEDGMLRGRLPFPFHPGDELVFDLVPASSNRFNPGLYRDGRLFNVEMGGTFEFELGDDGATAVRLRGIEGSLFGEGERTDG